MITIVNHMSEVNIDAALVRDGGAELSRTAEKLVELSTGCICCTLRKARFSDPFASWYLEEEEHYQHAH